MGWLDWSPQAVLQTDVNTVKLALIGKTEMLAAIHGGGKSTTPPRRRRMTADAFKAKVAATNAIKKGSGRGK